MRNPYEIDLNGTQHGTKVTLIRRDVVAPHSYDVRGSFGKRRPFTTNARLVNVAEAVGWNETAAIAEVIRLGSVASPADAVLIAKARIQRVTQ